MVFLFAIYFVSLLRFTENYYSFLRLDDYLLLFLGMVCFGLILKLIKNLNGTIVFKITLFCLVIGYFLKFLLIDLFMKADLFEPKFLSIAHDPILNIKAWESINLTLLAFLLAIYFSTAFKSKKPRARLEIFPVNEGKTKLLLFFLLVVQIVLGVFEVILGVGVLGLQTNLTWGIAGFIFYMRVIALPVLLYGILNASIESNDKFLQRMTLAELTFLGLSQMFISSSRSYFLLILAPAIGLYYSHGKLKRRQIFAAGFLVILLIIGLEPIITYSRYFRYDYGATKLVDSFENIDQNLSFENYSKALLFPLARFTGYDSLLYSVSGTDINKSLFEALNIVCGDYDAYFTYQVVGYNFSDQTFRMAPGIIGATYSLGGQFFVVFGCFAFFLFWFSVLNKFSESRLIVGRAIFYFLAFQYMAYLSEGYIEINRYIKFSLIFLIVFTLTERILSRFVVREFRAPNLNWKLS